MKKAKRVKMMKDLCMSVKSPPENQSPSLILTNGPIWECTVSIAPTTTSTIPLPELIVTGAKKELNSTTTTI